MAAVELNYERAQQVLEEAFQKAETAYLSNSAPPVPEEIVRACDVIFASKTQAYRETLLGCIVAKILEPQTNIRQPYVDQGEQAFSGRALDENVINRFLREKQVPCSRGPYLSVFRRSIEFDEATKKGLRDKAGYDAFLGVIAYAEADENREKLRTLVEYLLYRFVLLREEAKIELAKLPRISLPQYGTLISGLLGTPSGGRIPVMLVVAMLDTIKAVFELEWTIESAGINVADAAAGATGDITIRSDDAVLISMEVTERPVDAARVQATFRTKIAPSGVADYLFLVDIGKVSPEAAMEAQKYFAQGYEVNLVDIGTWLIYSLTTMGARGRATYNEKLTELFAADDTPKILKAAWNNEVLKLTGV